jgi:hypothetical protein
MLVAARCSMRVRFWKAKGFLEEKVPAEREFTQTGV